MRKKFSYILCMMFVLLGMNQSIYGAEAFGEEVANSLDRLGIKADAFVDGEEVSERTVAGIKNNAASLEEKLTQWLSREGVGLDEAAMKAARQSALDDILKNIAKEGNAAFTEPASEGAARALNTKTLTGSAAIAKAAVEKVEAEIKARPTSVPSSGEAAGPKASEGVVQNPGSAPAAKPQSLNTWGKLNQFGRELGDMSFQDAKIIGGNVKAFVTPGVKGVTRVGNILIGGPRTIEEGVFEKAPASSEGRTFKQLTRDQKAKFAGIENDVTEDTVFTTMKDGSLAPVENDPVLQKMGFPKYKQVGQPVFKTTIGGEFLTKDGYVIKLKDGKIFPEGAEPAQKTITVKDPSGAHWQMKDLFGDSVGAQRFGAIVSKIGGIIHMVGVNGMIMGMAMSVPNAIMAAFTSERLQQAALATVAGPQDFGGVVMQIPDELINETVPQSSLKIYVGVPVKNLGDQTQYGNGSSASVGSPVVGPSLDQPISKKIAELAQDQFKAFMATLMSGSKQTQAAGDSSKVARYSFFNGDANTASYYDDANTHLFCAWSPTSYIPWASSGMTDPNFTGLMIDLNTGLVFAGDGTSEGNAPAVLLGGPQGQMGLSTVEMFLSTYQSTLAATGLMYDYNQYTSSGQADKDVNLGSDSGLVSQFSSLCITKADTAAGIQANSGFGDNCIDSKTNKRSSLIATSLLRLAKGVCIDEKGHQLSLVPQAPILVPQLLSQGKAISNAASNAEALEDQISKFYTDPQQIINFAYQPKYLAAQQTLATTVYNKLPLAAQNACILAIATQAQDQKFINDWYESLDAAGQNDFVVKYENKTFKDNTSLMNYVFGLASANQQQSYKDTVFKSLSLSETQLLAFIKQFASPSDITVWSNAIFVNASDADKHAFAEQGVHAANQAQLAANNAAIAAAAAAAAVNQPSANQGDINQALKLAIAQGALGGVYPIYGLGNNLQSYLDTNFPGAMQGGQPVVGGSQTVVLSDMTTATQIKNASNGVTKIVKKGDTPSAGGGSQNSPKASNVAIAGGDNINYSAFGVNIYECQNTPFATELMHLTNKQGLDYIVFFDEFLNCVPLLVPIPQASKFNLPEFELNPAIAYWASLICYIGNGSGDAPQPLDAFMGRASDGTIFFPVYTLDGNVAYVPGVVGSNGNQGALDKILAGLQANQSGATSLINTANLYNQIEQIARHEVNAYEQGPFYAPCNLRAPDEKMFIIQASQTSNASIEVIPYIGMPPYPMTLNLGATSNATDYLIPFVTENGSSTTTQLPNPYVDKFVSLVSDIVFDVQVDDSGVATFVPTSYANSCYDPKKGLNSSKIGTYAWLENFANSSGVTVSKELIADVKVQRAAWVSFIEGNKNDPTFMAQSHGIAFGQNYTLSIANSDDYQNSIYMYTCSSQISGIAEDYYVMSASEVLPNKTVGAIANSQSMQPYIVSLATGFMYDSNGSTVKSSSGKPVSMDPAQLLALVNKNQGNKQVSTATIIHLAKITAKGASYLQTKQGPYEFGSLLLSLYRIDVENGNYVYFTTNQVGNPIDYFVVVKDPEKQLFGGPISGSTEYMVSLVTGQLYTRSGTSGDWPNLTTLLASVSNSMSISSVDKARINKLNADFNAQQAAEKEQEKSLEKQVVKPNQLILADIGNIAANLVAKPYLPAPYDSLVRDTDGKYYRITPDENGNPYIIFDFNATTATQDSHSADTQMGGMFTAKGVFITYMNGIHLAVMRQQYGVHVASNGVQTLAIPHIVGNMNLHDVDQALAPGKSGSALLASSDSQFPTPGIPSSIVSGKKTYYFYYHVFLHTYFVYVVDKASDDAYYISMDDGTEFNLDGSARIMHYQVARDSKGDLIVISQDSNGMLCVNMADPDPKSSTYGKYMNFLSDPSQFKNAQFLEAALPESFKDKPGKYGMNISYGATGGVKNASSGQYDSTVVYIYQDMLNQTKNVAFNANAQRYLIYAGDTKKFDGGWNVDVSTQVQALTYIPVDPKTGEIVMTPVEDLMNSANLIMQNGSMVEVIFGGVRYKASARGVFSPVSGSGESITLQTFATTQGCAAYVTISKGAKEYTYSYAYQSVDVDQFTTDKQAVWKLTGSVSSSSQSVLCKNLNLNARQPVSISAVKNVPDNLAAGIQATIKSITFDPISGKYFVPVLAADYNYFGQAGFVDIENGNFYDSTGMPLSYSLVLPDYIALLNKLNVMVVYNINSKAYDIIYRSAQAISQQNATVSAS